mmetsp:Transcript_137891/g.251167  ORF Transcript_137891/g.251167 Transcript_137891/m.251167 type:complete len:138 (+) Transcript_137891:3-416(+)
MAAELQAMGLGDSEFKQKIGPRPRPIEVSRLKALYTHTYQAYLNGEYRSTIHYRRKILAMFWAIWYRIVKHLKQVVISDPRSSGLFDLTAFKDASEDGQEHKKDALAARASINMKHMRAMSRGNKSMMNIFEKNIDL